jgi:2-polyprenyl-3-methyl-5-hydroxy-6-metoxy-1,4-benzoquinol methylase
MDIYEKLPDIMGRVGTVLEVGFGTGAGVMQYAHRVGVVDAIEPDPAAVRFAQRLFPLQNVGWICRGIEDWTPEVDYDFIVMIEVLEHVGSARAALRSVSSLLAPVGGEALITVPNLLRDRKRDEPLNTDNWGPFEFEHLLKDYFGKVRLVKTDLRTPITSFITSQTPIIARCS